jgi:hypothetical protein
MCQDILSVSQDILSHRALGLPSRRKAQDAL